MATTLGSAQTPVPISGAAELERQEQVASALHRLLALASDDPTVVTSQQELRDWKEELERLRCAVHLNDLDSCRSQHRLFSLHFALREDHGLREAESHLTDASEVERQDFFHGIYSRMNQGEFSSFGFSEENFKAALEQERELRLGKSREARERIQELEGLCLPLLQEQIASCGRAAGSFPWSSIAASQGGRWHTQLDALTLETPDDLWIVAEAQPSAITNCTSADSGQDVLIVVDLSGSMCHVLDVLKECLRDVVAHAQESDRLCLIGFSSEPTVLCDWIELGGNGGLQNRNTLCACVEAMEAGGGTRLVPALDLVGEQLRTRREPRPAAVVLLSDGDPEEPSEALSSAAYKAFSLEGSDPLVVAMALGHESRPDLMALLAQCGCGASLYISGQPQLALQLGRMWGLLAASRRAADAKARGSLHEAFLILEPGDGSQFVETERSPGGLVPLASSDGRQLLALRCGRHAPAGDGSCRLAARLALPPWARSPLEAEALQRPLLRATWVWRDASGAVKAASDTLRALQVPELLVEAKVGLPLRVVMAVDSEACESFERERFVNALASALGLESSRLSLERVTPGSIIADLQILDAEITDARKLDVAESTEGCASLAEVLETQGFESACLKVPGRRALRRVLQWRLAAALEATASGLPNSQEALAAVAAAARSREVRRYDVDPNPASGGAAAVLADAMAAEQMLADGLAPCHVHALQQQSHAHCQQLCPELEPSCHSLGCYELSALKEASIAFGSRAEVRSQDLRPAAPVLSFDSSSLLQLSSEDAPDVAAAITSFQVEVHHGDRCSTTEVPVRAGAQCLATLHLSALEPGAEHAVVASGRCGRIWGERSAPLLCRLYTPAAPLPPSPSRARHGRARRSSSLARSAVETCITEASATAVGTLSLAWELLPRERPELRWCVRVEAEEQEVTPLLAEDLSECHTSFTGLAPSISYRFTISATAPALQAPPQSPQDLRHRPMAELSVTGSRLGAPAVSMATLPKPLEGIVVLPPFSRGKLAALEADPYLKPSPLGLQGIFLRVPGGRSRNT
eukprot:TRINITY_DN36725_c0_g1_i1.p1 TRINITY_DN36725_c0_g1~~TRINITY_DN36725_c0_g1_i1.p1  ORF type:complete len:1056 (+),score=201.17 TRINITY_DN36725_c0_g1_i1:34-3168(+)